MRCNYKVSGLGLLAAVLLTGFPASEAVETLHELSGFRQTPSWPGPIPAVSEIDIEAYTGRWFQVYTNFLVQYTFELGGVCVTADYGLLPNGTGISVHNAQNFLEPNGTTTIINGNAMAMNASEPGKLTVNFDAIPFPGSYWIIKLGPIEDGAYQYSVVTDAYAITLFILARDPGTFADLYEEEVKEFVDPLFSGFLRKPRLTVQGAECLYSPEPSPSNLTVEGAEGKGNTHDEAALASEDEDEMAASVARLRKDVRSGRPQKH